MVDKAERETRMFERLKFWITLTLKWIIKNDKTEETNIFTTCKVLLLAQRCEGFVFPKKMGALKGCRGHMEGLGKILKSLQKQYGHEEQPSQDTQSYDCED